MKTTSALNAFCPVEKTIDKIGGKYKALILWHLMNQTLRFGELRKRVPEATPKMLTQQLREMETDALIHREVYPVVPPKVEYSLTEKGKSLQPVLVAMHDWGSTQMREEGVIPHCSMTENPLQGQPPMCGHC